MKEGWTKIGTICNIRTGKLDANAASENGAYPFFTCADKPLRIDKYSYDEECILIAGNGDLNVKYYKGKFDAYQRTYILTLKENVNNVFLPYIFNFFLKYITHLRIQSIGGIIKYIRLGNLTEAKVHIPELSRQQQIVSELNLLNGTIEKKRAQIEELNKLTQSIFYDMFGDPVSNEKDWIIKKLGEECTDMKYGTSRPACENGRFKYLRMGNVTLDGHLDLTDLKNIDVPEEEVDKCIVRYGDILFNRTNSHELIGKTCMFDLDEEMIIAGYLIRVRLSQNISPRYLSIMFNLPSMKKLLRSIAKGAVNQANINSKELASIKIPIPPLSLQQEFAAKVEAIEQMKAKVRQSLKESEELFNSRMDYYFS